MRQLGEQWIVKQDDGRNHLIEKVDAKEGHYKDLGPVNKDGLLACPFCKQFPKSVSKGTEYKNDCEISIFYIEHSCNVIQSNGFCYTEQEAIDAWNRRA